jgi:hypothetical protein
MPGPSWSDLDEFAYRWNTRKSLGIEDFQRAGHPQRRRRQEADISTA